MSAIDSRILVIGFDKLRPECMGTIKVSARCRHRASSRKSAPGIGL